MSELRDRPHGRRLLEPVRVHGYPWRWLRDKSGEIIGEFSLEPDPPGGLKSEEMLRLDPAEQRWGMGYALVPSWRGRGLASQMVDLILNHWVKQWMGIGKVTAVRSLIVCWAKLIN